MLLWAFRQLCVPCNYLRIKHGDRLLESKVVYDFVLPGVLTAVTVGFAVLLDMKVTVFGNRAVFDALSGLLSILIGFYMAALAAVATFDRKGIDDPLKGGDAILVVRARLGGEPKPKKLSYRQFISYLFGYASFLAFIIYAVLLLAGSAWPKLVMIAAKFQWWPEIMEQVIDPLTFVLVFFALWQLFVTSLLGIYFLAERIQSLYDPDR